MTVDPRGYQLSAKEMCVPVSNILVLRETRYHSPAQSRLMGR